MAYRALLLDLDDTLFDRTAAFESWAELAMGRALTTAESQLLLELDGRGHRSREAFAADARTHFGLSVDPAQFGHMLARHIVREAGTVETVTQLAADRRIAIVTNGGSAQRAKLAAIGLADIVHEVFVSGEVGITKPSLGIFERALHWTQHAPEHVLYVGDDPVIDLAPAASLGMATAWRVVRGRTWPSELALPTHRIDRITELAAL